MDLPTDGTERTEHGRNTTTTNFRKFAISFSYYTLAQAFSDFWAALQRMLFLDFLSATLAESVADSLI